MFSFLLALLNGLTVRTGRSTPSSKIRIAVAFSSGYQVSLIGRTFSERMNDFPMRKSNGNTPLLSYRTCSTSNLNAGSVSFWPDGFCCEQAVNDRAMMPSQVARAPHFLVH